MILALFEIGSNLTHAIEIVAFALIMIVLFWAMSR
jgi:hypothetical protein